MTAVLSLSGADEDETKPETEAATPSEIETTESEPETEESTTEAEFVPSIDELNLAYIFPDEADQEDRLNSYAGEVYKELMKKDNEYLARIVDTSGMSPRSLAAKLGVSGQRVMGKYNPSDGSQNPDDPGSWYIPDFKNVNVAFRDSDGRRINESSNVKDIMAMASVYCYTHDSLDPEAFRKYCEELYGKSRSYSISIGNVYYDDGCINRSAKEEADDIKRIEHALSQLKKLLLEDGDAEGETLEDAVAVDESDVAKGGGKSSETTGFGDGSTSTASESGSGDEKSMEGSSEAGSDAASKTGNGEAETKSAGTGEASESHNLAADESAAAQNEPTETIPDAVEIQELVSEMAKDRTEGTTRIVGTGIEVTEASVQEETVSYDSASETTASEAAGETASDNDAESVSEESSGTRTESAAEKSSETAASMESSDSGEAEDQSGAVQESGESLAESESQTDEASKGYSDSEKGSGDAKKTSVEDGALKTILSSFSKEDLRKMDDATLFSLIEEAYEASDSKKDGNTETDVKSKNYCPGHVDLYVNVTISGFDDEKGLRNIKLSSDFYTDEWTEDMIAAVKSLASRDWYKTYGFSISTIDPKNPLTDEEISKYLDGLPKDISSKRKSVIRFALESVGKIPYYYGGKAGSRGYEKNHFGSIVSSDYRGRVLRGLDCSGWIQWVYWSAIGDDLNGSASTSSLVGEGEKIKRADLQPGDIIIREGSDSHVVMFLSWSGNGKMIAIHENSTANNVSVNEVTASYPYYRKLIN
ncbi:hypothetical protein BXO88_09235 [Oribacterium sp. C9]|uniref:NlpC/P60 family protein n=1 Tax=Oribacterium sp. C9 TaxID=1943579 RepID=UPI0009CA1652|nr:NlpC/P60 family protein [Oribacterium sp. C9]OON86011.1 hypothetical protein BXO88_09235 [Oribacterium sp. C9]